MEELRRPLLNWWRVLCVGAGVLVVLGPLARIVDNLGDDDPHDVLEPWARLFDLTSEANLPTVYSTALLLALAAALVIRAAIGPDAQRPAWLVLAALAALLGVDESATLHEEFLGPLGREAGGGDGLLTFAWVIPGAALAILAVVVLARMIRHLPALVRRRLGVAVAVFLAGALGLEAVSGAVQDERGRGRIYYGVTTIEEALEFTGVLLALRAVLAGVLVARSVRTLTISRPEEVGDPERAATDPAP